MFANCYRYFRPIKDAKLATMPINNKLKYMMKSLAKQWKLNSDAYVMTSHFQNYVWKYRKVNFYHTYDVVYTCFFLFI